MVLGRKFKRSKRLGSKVNTVESTGNHFVHDFICLSKFPCTPHHQENSNAKSQFAVRMPSVRLYIFLKFLVSVSFIYTEISLEEPDYDKLEYGNILREEVEDVKYTDDDVKKAVERAELYLQKQMKVRPKEYEILGLKKVNLLYTENESEPYQPQDTAVTNLDSIDGKPLSFGKLFFLTLIWESDDDEHSHRFVISQYKEDYYVYTHTFSRFSKCEAITESEKENKYSQNANNDDSVTDQSSPREPSKIKICSDQLQTEKQSCDYKLTSDCSTDFTVMTYNIWNTNAKPKYSHERYKERINHLVKVVRESNPDIVCFQEVRFQAKRGGDLGPSQMEHLYTMLPEYEQFIFIPAQLQGNSLKNGRTEEGVAIFSKFPILSFHHKFLFRNRSNDADRHQRVLLHAEIQHTSGTKINVMNTHFSLSHEARAKKVVEIWHYIKDVKGPVVLVGDFNEFPEKPPMRFLRGEETLEGYRASGITDSWQLLRKDEAGFTFSCLRPEPTERIDYIYFRDGEGLVLKKIALEDDGLKGEKAASDHSPLQALFSLQDLTI